MTTYLQMDGVDDRIALPSMTFTEIVMDFRVNSKGNFERYWSLPLSAEYFQAASGGINDQWSAGVSALYLDGVAQTNLTVVMVIGTRGVARAVLSAAKTNTLSIFSNGTGNIAHGDMWDVKVYNGATLAAHYDMSTGTVQDQSGNGLHATLTGGTWLDDGVGGGTEYTASLSDNFTPSDMISKRLSVAVVDNVGTAESLSTSGGSALNVSDSLAITDSIRKALSIAKSDIVTTGETESDAISRHLTDGFALTDTLRKTLNKSTAESLGIAESIGHSVNVRLYDVLLTEETFTKDIPNAPVIIGRVALNGSRELNVYLLGSRVLDVTLRGEV